ncbi:zinc transporter ZIP13 homolog [Amphibalanus amphitrite]|uniref:zinc transporter ZIP13 homolog n=1 Tax=Amphibalanus amphitrite TaxID=1232801 RepID=UPI001C8FBAC3|nr:zinc transporter ZIP13 homolog [Amphibalanus amphitrite]
MAVPSRRHVLSALLPLLLLTAAAGELHRAKHQRAFPRSGEPSAPAAAAGPLAALQQLYTRHEPVVLSVVGAALVGFSGILPLLVIPLETGARLKERDGERRLRLLLSFAVGGLLGDVFLHLLPEAMEHAENPSEQIHVGMWVIGGVFFFVLLEMLFSQSLSQEEPEPEPEPEPRPEPEPERAPNGAGELRRRPAGHTVLNGSVKGAAEPPPAPPRPPPKQAAGYLNLLANSVDNFTHGLAIGGSFLASTRIGLLTTFAILIHEIPHEVGDFAILLKSGFSRWEAAKAQLATATLGITGAISALLADDPRALGDRTAWILPFTAGGFIHIALVGVLPEVCREREPRQCLKQVLCMAAGVLVMLTVTVAFEH